jgi:hypothetical protein
MAKRKNSTPFEHWTINGVCNILGLKYVRTHVTLEAWLQVKVILTAEEERIIAHHQNNLLEHIT